MFRLWIETECDVRKIAESALEEVCERLNARRKKKLTCPLEKDMFKPLKPSQFMDVFEFTGVEKKIAMGVPGHLKEVLCQLFTNSIEACAAAKVNSKMKVIIKEKDDNVLIK